TEDGVAAPGAREWAAACSDQRHRPLTMVFAPDVDVLGLIDSCSIWQRLRVQIGDHGSWLGTHNGPVRIAISDACDRLQPGCAMLDEVRDELRERQLAFADGNYVGTPRQVLIEVIRWIRAADNHT